MAIIDGILGVFGAKGLLPLKADGQMPKNDDGKIDGAIPKTMSLQLGDQGTRKDRATPFDVVISARQRYILRKRHSLVAAVHNAIVKQVKKVEIEVEVIDKDEDYNDETKKRMEAFIQTGFGVGGEKEFRGDYLDVKKWYGDAFAEVVFDAKTKEPLLVNQLIAETINIKANEHGQIIGYPQVVDGIVSTVFPPENMLHLREHRDEYSFFGYSDLDALFTILLLDAYADDHNTELLKNNASSPGIVAFDDDVDETALKNLRWEVILQLRQHPGRPIFMNKIKQWIPMTSGQDINWQVLQQKTKERVMMVYGVLPMQVAVVETGKLANPEQQLEVGDEYIWQELQALENLYNIKFTPHFENSENLKFKFCELTPKPEAIKMEADTKLVRANIAKTLSTIPGTFTKNEIRDMVDFEPLQDGGDETIALLPAPTFGAVNPPNPQDAQAPPTQEQGAEPEDEGQAPPPQSRAMKESVPFVKGETKDLRIHKMARVKRTAKFAGQLLRLQSEFTRKAIRAAKEHYPGGKSKKTLSGFNSALGGIVIDISARMLGILKDNAKEAYKDSKLALGGTFAQPDIRAVESMLTSSGALDGISGFTKAQKDGFSQVMRDSLEQGLDLKKMVKEMQNISSAEEYRLERIARTETNRFANQGRFAGYDELETRRGEEFKYEWVGPSDERTTEICTDIKAQNPYSLNDIMTATDGGEPHINCRHNVVRIVD